MKKECDHTIRGFSVLSLRCLACKGTWSDPMRATQTLIKFMRDKPALKHNINILRSELAGEVLEEEIKRAVENLEIVHQKELETVVKEAKIEVLDSIISDSRYFALRWMEREPTGEEVLSFLEQVKRELEEKE